MERELWNLLYVMTYKLDKSWGRWKYSTGDILVTYWWCVINDRPMCWAVDKANWPDDLRPRWLPPQSTLSRRMRRPDAQCLMVEIEQAWLAATGACYLCFRMIDGKPLAVSGVSKDADAGYGRGAGGMQKGYKLHAVWSSGPLPLAWALGPMNRSEKTMARALIAGLPGAGYLVGDPEFDCNALYAFQEKTARQDLRHLGIPGRMLRIEFRGHCTEVPDACCIAVYEG